MVLWVVVSKEHSKMNSEAIKVKKAFLPKINDILLNDSIEIEFRAFIQN
jgi:hypothetical protein